MSSESTEKDIDSDQQIASDLGFSSVDEYNLWKIGQGNEEPIEKLKRFPMQRGPDIDWETARTIYNMYSYVFGDNQSLERIAERGGFGWAEVEKIQEKYTRKKA